MSNITGEGESFSSGNTTAVGEVEVHQQQEQEQEHLNHLNSIASRTTNTANGSTAEENQPTTVFKKKRSLPGNPGQLNIYRHAVLQTLINSLAFYFPFF